MATITLLALVLGPSVCLTFTEFQNFLVVYPSTAKITEGTYFEALISTTAESAKVQVMGAKISETRTVQKDKGYRLFISTEDYHLDRYAEVERKAILLQSEEPIAVHCHLEEYGTTGGYMLLPIGSNDRQFIIPSFTPLSRHASDIIIAAVNNHTVVILTYPNGSSSTVTLPSFGTYTVKSKNDLTGTLVTADAPIAVYSGHQCATVPIGGRYCDRLIEHIPPLHYSGLRYIIPPIGGRDKDTGYFIRVLFPTGKHVSVNGKHYSDRYTEINITKNAGYKITCANKCFIYQYNTGGAADTSFSDPFMMRILPESQFEDRFMWMTPRLTYLSKGNVYNHYVTIVAFTNTTAGVTLDGKIVNSSSWSVVENSSFSTTFLTVNEGSHFVEHVNGSKIAAYAYGHGNTSLVAYGFPAGPAGFTPQRASDLNDICTSNLDFDDSGNEKHSNYSTGDQALSGVATTAGFLFLALIITWVVYLVKARQCKLGKDNITFDREMSRISHTRSTSIAGNPGERIYESIREKRSTAGLMEVTEISPSYCRLDIKQSEEDYVPMS